MYIKDSMKRIVLFVLAICLISQSFGVIASAKTPLDVEQSWAAKTLSDWLSKGWLHGYPDGSVRPNQSVTRAEFAQLTNNVLGLTATTTISYRDVKAGSWQSTQIAKAVNAGYMQGYGSDTMQPDGQVSREEAAVMVAAAFHLDVAHAGEPAFTDEGSISVWASKSIDAIFAKGIVAGYPDGTFRPRAFLTRAEAVVMLDKAIKASVGTQAFDAAGTFGPVTGMETIEGNVSIGAGGVTLRNIVITGDLLLAESIGEGDVYLNNVTVKGMTTVLGGGANSVYLKDSVLVNVTVDKNNGQIRIVAEGKTIVKQVILFSGAVLQSNAIAGFGFDAVELSGLMPANAMVTFRGEFPKVDIHAPDIVVHVEANAVINELILNVIVTIVGQGTIVKAVLSDNAKGSTFEKQPLSMANDIPFIPPNDIPFIPPNVINSSKLTIDRTNPPNGQIGISYAGFLTSTGGTGARQFAVIAGSLPAGLTLSAIGEIRGIPTEEGESTFTASVTDSTSATSAFTFTLTIDSQSTGLEAFNAATGVEAVLALLGMPHNQAELDLSMNAYYLLTSSSRMIVATTVYQGGWDYYSAVELNDVFDAAVTAQSVIMDLNNAATTGETLQSLIANQSGLALNLSSGSSFDSLPTTLKEALAAALMSKRPFYTATAIKRAFDAELAARTLVAAMNAAANAEETKLFLESRHVELDLNMDAYDALSLSSQTAVATKVFNFGADYFETAAIKLSFNAEIAVQSVIAPCVRLVVIDL